MQGLNTTPVHGHTALFGVYGMLGLGLMLFCLRALRPGNAWKNAPLAFAFWAINIGTCADGPAKHAAHRVDASLGIGGIRHLVRTISRVLALRPHQPVAL